MSEYNLSIKVSDYLDTKLIILLIDFLITKDIFSINELEETKKTLLEKVEIPISSTSSSYTKAKELYNIGQYNDAITLFLENITNKTMELQSYWGLLNSYIMSKEYIKAKELLNNIYELINNTSFVSNLIQLEQRLWLAHVSLFIFFNIDDNTQVQFFQFIDFLYKNDILLNAIQIKAPYIFRYIVSSLILSVDFSIKLPNQLISSLVKHIKYEDYHHDPILSFFMSLYNDYDFDKAGECILLCQNQVILNDYFLHTHYNRFMNNIRKLMLIVYIKTYQRIDMSILKSQFNLNIDELTNFIQSYITEKSYTHIEIKDNYLIVKPKMQNIHEQVQLRTSYIPNRINAMTKVISNDIEKEKALLLANQQQEEEEEEEVFQGVKE